MIEFNIVDQVVEFTIGEEVTFEIVQAAEQTIIFEQTGPQGPKGDAGHETPELKALLRDLRASKQATDTALVNLNDRLFEYLGIITASIPEQSLSLDGTLNTIFSLDGTLSTIISFDGSRAADTPKGEQ